MPDITKYRKAELSKGQWKKKIRKATEDKNEKELKEKIRHLDKLHEMKEESYVQKAYLTELNLEDARMMFRIRTRSIKCKMNHSSSYANKASLWQCPGCGYIDTQSHILY